MIIYFQKKHHRNVLFVSFKRTQISQIQGIFSLSFVIYIPKICGSIFLNTKLSKRTKILLVLCFSVFKNKPQRLRVFAF